MVVLGPRMRRLRLARGMTQKELAAPRYSYAYVSTIESGRRNPSKEAIEHFAAAVKSEPAYMEAQLQWAEALRNSGRLEESLTQNLSAVQKTHNFEDMAINLSAAIQLLSARLGHPFGIRSKEVAGGDAASQAA